MMRLYRQQPDRRSSDDIFPYNVINVHLDGRTKLALNLVLVVDESTDSDNLVIVPITDLDVVIDTHF